VADPVTLAHWEALDVKLGAVLDRLDQVRRETARAASRTSVLTLVIVAGDDEQAAEARSVMASLGAHHPARVLVLRAKPDAPDPGVDARVTVYGAEVASHPVSFEEIALDVRAGGCDHLDSIIEPFTLSDLPLVLWYPSSLPEVSDCLLPVADTVIVDSRETGAAETLQDLVDLARRRVAVDLSWERLAPWRELLAGLFDSPVYRPFASTVASIEVQGKPGPRRLLAGWLRSRLGPPEPEVHLTDARHVALRLRASHEGRSGTFEVVRNQGERVVRASAVVEGGPSHTEVLALPDNSLAWSLSRALTHLRRDRTWEQALSAAVGLTG
jgi:glucose-6-phosphate dehydrogenase assembly protein OpcA